MIRRVVVDNEQSSLLANRVLVEEGLELGVVANLHMRGIIQNRAEASPSSTRVIFGVVVSRHQQVKGLAVRTVISNICNFG